jgi:hypothetical protein
MQFKRKTPDDLAAGTINLAFGRWRRPTVRPSGRLRTSRGVVLIETIDVIDQADVPGKGSPSRRGL